MSDEVKAAADRLRAALRSLAELVRLQRNWDSYGADAPSSASVERARNVLSILAQLDLSPSSVDASAEGGICISFVKGERYADIECFNTGQVLAVSATPTDEPSVWYVETDEDGIRTTAAMIKSFLNR